jgi:stage II sporulation protein D
VVSVVQGDYILRGDDRQVALLREGDIIHLDYSTEGILVNDTAKRVGIFQSLEMRGMSSENVFLAKPVYPSLDARESDDDLIINTYGEGLVIINRLDLEKYVAGTIEAEGGINENIEYYKAQAVLARTYAINHFTRHAPEGFNLCDDQHCQAFHGKSRWNDEIYEATLATRNQILIGPDGQPAATAYHASCGGVTSSASIAWNEDLPYLFPVNDPFCLESDNAQWNMVIPLAEWTQYLLKRGVVSLVLPDNLPPAPARLKYFDFGDRSILLSDIRQDLQLKSAFITMSQQGSNIIIEGRGYGHGVGLCQEGAMQMARLGYVYVDILMFYFRDLTLSDYQSDTSR